MEPTSPTTPTTSGDDRRVRPPRLLRRAVRRLERESSVDPVASRLAIVAEPLGRGRQGDVLRGRWLGHALHPLLTDVPIGCWLSASLLDLVGGPSSRVAARRLVGLGLLATPATVATGLADWSELDAPETRRVGAVHAAGNGLASVCYLLSWRARRRDHHARGAVWGLLGVGLTSATGYLGGHLSYARSAGVGDRGLRLPPMSTLAAPPVVREELVDVRAAATTLGLTTDRVQAMVDEGMLTPVDRAGNGPRFRVAEVEAIRLQGA